MKETLFKIVGTGLAVGVLAVNAIAGFSNGFTGSPAPVALSVTLTNQALGNNGINAGINVGNIILPGNVTVVEVDAIVTGGGSGQTALINFYDCPSNCAPYYGLSNIVTSAYTSVAGYPTNYVTSMVGYNGYTNYYTNAGYWHYYVMNNPSTNALNPLGSVFAVNGVISKFPSEMLFSQGVSVTVSTNVQLIVYYVPNK